MLLRTFNEFACFVINMRSLIVVRFICLLCFVSAASSDPPIKLAGYYVESDKALYNPEDAAFNLPSQEEITLKLFGENFLNSEMILFTKQKFSENESCDTMDHTSSHKLSDLTNTVATAHIIFRTATDDDLTYFMCMRDKDGKYHHLGDKSRILVVNMSDQIMPIPLQVGLVCLCFLLSSIFSGLNLGLMSLDVSELKLIMKCGSADDKKYAHAILPIRKRGNTLLCTLLFGNTIVNASLTLLLDNLIGQGVYALVGSTVGILIFGEIVPQSICSRYGLRVGYYCRYVVLFFMFGLFPVTFSLGKLLDLILGREIHQVYSRDELREMVKMSFALDTSRTSSQNGFGGKSGLKREEVNIVTGALEITEATVSSIMKPKEEIFMLDISVAIDYDLIELITRHGYTRIPIFANGDRNNIVGLLSTKDLLGIDPEDKLPLNSLVEYYPRSILRVLESTTILDMLNLFKTAKVHLAIVDKIFCDEEHDPIKEMVGIVTLEDVIEFILREEIDDEADDLKERRKQEEMTENKSQAMMPFKRADTIPQQLNTAAVQFLIANVEAFRKEIVERKVLANLLRFPGTFIVKKCSGKFAGHHGDNTLYSADKEADYFILILQGCCQVFIGRERLPFEAGPFHYFGLEALIGVGNVPLLAPSICDSPRSSSTVSPRSFHEDPTQQQLISAMSSHSPGYYEATSTLTLRQMGRQINRSGKHAKRLLSSLTQIGSKDRNADAGSGKPNSQTISGEDDLHLKVHKGLKFSYSRQGSMSSLGSVHPAYQFTRKSFVPDFTVEITQDVQYVRLTNAHYRALLAVTQLVRRKNKLDDTAFILDKLWLELIREGEQYPNFELIAPILPPHSASELEAAPVGRPGRTPSASSNPVMPLRVSIPNEGAQFLGLRKDYSHPDFCSGSHHSTPLSNMNDSSFSLSTPNKSRHVSPLHTALLHSSRQTGSSSTGIGSPPVRKRSATASGGECEPLMKSTSPDASNTPDP